MKWTALEYGSYATTNSASIGPIAVFAFESHATAVLPATSLQLKVMPLTATGLSMPGMPVNDMVESNFQLPLNASTVALTSGGAAGCAGGAGGLAAAASFGAAGAAALPAGAAFVAV